MANGTIKFNWLGRLHPRSTSDEFPAFTSLGDNLKTFQSLFNYMARSAGYNEPTIRIEHSLADFEFSVYVNMPTAIFNQIIDDMRRIWTCINSNDYTTLLSIVQINLQALNQATNSSYNPDSLMALVKKHSPAQSPEGIEFTRITTIDPNIKILTHLTREFRWEF